MESVDRITSPRQSQQSARLDAPLHKFGELAAFLIHNHVE